MRILFAVPNVPSLIRPRPFQFIRRLSRSHEVTVVCLATNDSDRRSIADLRQACPRVEVFHLPWWQSLWNCLLALLSLTPLRVAYFSSSRLRKCVEEKVNRGEVDLVHAEHVKMIPMVEKIVPRTPAVLDADRLHHAIPDASEKRHRKPFQKTLYLDRVEKDAAL